jgi:hypothetical protein
MAHLHEIEFDISKFKNLTKPYGILRDFEGENIIHDVELIERAIVIQMYEKIRALKYSRPYDKETYFNDCTYIIHMNMRTRPLDLDDFDFAIKKFPPEMLQPVRIVSEMAFWLTQEYVNLFNGIYKLTKSVDLTNKSLIEDTVLKYLLCKEEFILHKYNMDKILDTVLIDLHKDYYSLYESSLNY